MWLFKKCETNVNHIWKKFDLHLFLWYDGHTLFFSKWVKQIHTYIMNEQMLTNTCDSESV